MVDTARIALVSMFIIVGMIALIYFTGLEYVWFRILDVYNLVSTQITVPLWIPLVGVLVIYLIYSRSR